ncbi:MAG: ABC transporter permease subunit, partial [Bdellovibrionales bacterium]|nr:ABC transporter permease subunit [Bdellovibrionales bacterium]
MKGLWILGFFLLLAIFAPWLTTSAPNHVFSDKDLLPPFFSQGGSFEHWLGTDDLGRDLWSRLVYGARVSIGLGFLIVLISMVIGSLLGLLAGFFGGATDRIVMRFVDVMMSLPSLLLAMVVVAILGPGLLNAVWAVAAVSLPGYIRIVRASV